MRAERGNLMLGVYTLVIIVLIWYWKVRQNITCFHILGKLLFCCVEKSFHYSKFWGSAPNLAIVLLNVRVIFVACGNSVTFIFYHCFPLIKLYCSSAIIFFHVGVKTCILWCKKITPLHLVFAEECFHILDIPCNWRKFDDSSKKQVAMSELTKLRKTRWKWN